MSLGNLLRRSTGFYESKSDILMSCRSDFVYQSLALCALLFTFDISKLGIACFPPHKTADPI